MVAMNADNPTTVSAAVASNPSPVNFGTFAELAEKKKAERPSWVSNYGSNYVPYQTGYVWRGNGWVSKEKADEMDRAAAAEKCGNGRPEGGIDCAWSPSTVELDTRADLPPMDEEPVVEVDVPTDEMLDAMQDEIVGQVKAYVSEIQSCAYHFEKNPDGKTMDDLLGATDGLSAFLLHIMEGK